LLYLVPDQNAIVDALLSKQ